MFPCVEFDLTYFQTAPCRFVFERDVPVSAACLFATFEDESTWPKWIAGIDQVTWTSPRPFGPNTTRTVRFIGGMEIYEHFLTWIPEKELAFCLSGATQRVWNSFGERYQIEATGPNRCQLTWTVAYEPRFIFAKLHPLLSPLMKGALSLAANNLVRFVQENA